MRSVSRFESNLLRILHSFLDQSDVSHVLSAIKRPESPPPCLSRDAVELVKQSLRNGTVTLLAREGGWAQSRHLRDDQIREGNLWQRTEPSELGLDFSPHSLDFLIAKEALARSDASYVGMIGSKTKLASFRNWMRRDSGEIAGVDRLVCPIGGSGVSDKRPEVIAALVAAELVQYLSARSAKAGVEKSAQLKIVGGDT